MREWIPLLILILFSALMALHYAEAQSSDKKQSPPAVSPDKATTQRKGRDVDNMPIAAQPIFNSAQRAMDWLKRTHKADGRFVYGFQPALCVLLDGDNFSSQAGAAFALARAARYFGDEGSTVKARQAILTLLLETMLDPRDGSKSSRHLAALPAAVDRLSAHGLLISAIHELDQVEKCPDLLKQADELCNYLRLQQREDAALFVADGGKLIKGVSEEVDAQRAGWALQGIIRSHRHRPAEWKLDMLRKARTYYVTSWKKKKSIAATCALTPAFAEAFVLTKDGAYKDAVFA